MTSACCMVFVKSCMPGFVGVSRLQSDLVYIVLVELYKGHPSTHMSLGKRNILKGFPNNFLCSSWISYPNSVVIVL